MITHTHLDAVFKFKPLSRESPDQIRKLVSVYVGEHNGTRSNGYGHSTLRFHVGYILSQ